jgi:hypothetical protein
MKTINEMILQGYYERMKKIKDEQAEANERKVRSMQDTFHSESTVNIIAYDNSSAEDD